jgi:hypothetical protein
MTAPSDLETLERGAFRKFYEDGLFDIFFGLMLIAMAIGAVVSDWLRSEGAGTLAMLAISVGLVLLLAGARRRLLPARLGSFRPGPERRRKISTARLALLGSVVAGVVVFASAVAACSEDVSVTSVEFVLPVAWFLNSVLVLGATAHFLDVPRFYFYGVLFGLVLPLLIWPDVLWGARIPPWVALGGVGVAIGAVGFSKLRRFLRQYPPLSSQQDASHAGF